MYYSNKDYIKAYKWFLQAANKGHGGAQNNLGVMLEYGQGVEMNRNNAIAWYKYSADSGNQDGVDNYERLSKK